MGWFSGLVLLPPGLDDVRDWRPGHAALRNRWGPRPAARFLAALARKPTPACDQLRSPSTKVSGLSPPLRRIRQSEGCFDAYWQMDRITL
jgi:hypothetical protein